MIGAGALGLGIAWHLAREGHVVSLFDQRLNEPVQRQQPGQDLTGTTASLGVLMGHVFRRSSGRGWRLRRQSIKLWPGWIQTLQIHEPELMLHVGLLQIADDEAAAARMAALAEERRDLGLRMVDPEALKSIWPTATHGALQSVHDGRIDPLLLQIALRKALHQESVNVVASAVHSLCRQELKWMVNTTDEPSSSHDAVVICTALASDRLLEPLGHSRPMTPVLGQAIRLQVAQDHTDWTGWPAVLVTQGFNLIPDGPGQFLLGATVEPGTEAAEGPLALMRSLHDQAPEWLRSATVIEHWSGLRARPVERPAPLLELLEPGLLLASGHYRNGVLLMPASAEWIAAELNHNLSITGT